MYAVTIEPENRLMRITVQGFWPENVIPACVAELQPQAVALERVRAAIGRHGRQPISQPGA